MRRTTTLWRLNDGEMTAVLSPKIVVLLIGANNFLVDHASPHTTAIGIKAVVYTLRRLSPTTRVLLLSVLPNKQTPLSDTLSVNQEISSYTTPTGTVRYLDLTSIFLDSNRDVINLDDLVHPNSVGFELM